MLLEKVLHKCEEKMQEKGKMTQQEDENLVQGQQHCSVYFRTKIFFKCMYVCILFDSKDSLQNITGPRDGIACQSPKTCFQQGPR